MSPKSIRNGMMLAGLAMGLAFAQPGDDQTDVGARQVSLKPISTSDFGHYGGPNTTVYLAVAGIALIVVGGLITGKVITK